QDRFRGRVGPQTAGKVTEFCDLGLHLERPVVEGGEEQFAGALKTGLCKVLVLVFDDEAVDALLGRLARLAVADIHARQRLQLKGDVLEDVRGVSAAAQALKEPAALTDAATVLDQSR